MFQVRTNEPAFDFPLFTGDLGDFLKTSFNAPARDCSASESLSPAIETYKRSDNYLVRVEVPGIDPKEVDISFKGELLTIKGQRLARELEDGETCLMSESAYGDFEKSLRLSEAIEVDKIHASYRDGVLEITLPVSEESKPRKIAIETGEIK